MASKSVDKRKRSRDSDIWLIGKPIERFPGTKLPSRGEVLRVTFNLHKSSLELKQHVKRTAKMLLSMDNAKIPTFTRYRIIDKITRLHKDGLWKSQGCTVRWHQNNGRSASDESPIPEMLDAFGSGTLGGVAA